MKKIILTVIAGLLASALALRATPSSNIVISSLPFTVTAPGTYVLARDLTVPAGVTDAITVPLSAISTGPVVIDLKGHTLTGPGTANYGRAIFIGSITSGSSGNYPVTIRNGTLKDFSLGVNVYTQGTAGVLVSGITINSINFIITPVASGSNYGVLFQYVGGSAVNNCSISCLDPNKTVTYGIFDLASGGNSYSNDSFSGGVITPLSVEGRGLAFPLILDRCQFNPAVK